MHAAMSEFCRKGYDGARTAVIARRASCNIRMIYHYYGSKEGLYLAALERVYAQIRTEEAQLDLQRMSPIEGISALVEFTFDHMAAHEEFVRLATIENIQHGRYLKKSKAVPQQTQPLIKSISGLLHRGQLQGVFRPNVDPVQLYVSILALSLTHLSNRYTLSITYQQDMGNPGWLAKRREHVRQLVLSYLQADAAGPKSAASVQAPMMLQRSAVRG
ncbi:MAG TPA: TetR/AcrR family transcriptional regulator [Alphaproteobacteria bacterium]|nr:TetR/AcrR family transcriptional regulator [Alphaproteobacteria bacterium]